MQAISRKQTSDRLLDRTMRDKPQLLETTQF